MSDQIIVSESMLDSLKATRPWVKFLAILGFVFIGLMILIGLIATLALSAAPSRPGMPAFGPAFGLFYILLSGIYVMPCLFMYRYAKAIARIPMDGRTALEDALGQQKSLWKYMGIFAIVILALYALLIIGGIAFGIMAGLSHHS